MAIAMFAILVAIACVIITYYVKRLYSFWERMDVPHIKPILPYGNFKGAGTKYFQGEITQMVYNEMKGKGLFCGVYLFYIPVALALDLEFIKNVLVKDFTYFHDRGLFHNEKDDPLSAHLFAIEGNKWRNLRTKLTPVFSSGKMKFMYPTVLATANELKSTLDDLLLSKESMDVEIKDLLARYTTDVIGECAFGIECNSLKNPNAEFRRMGRMILEKRRNGRFGNLLALTFQSFARLMGLKSTLEEVEKFFLGIVKDTVEYRENNPSVSRNDFMHLLIKIKNGQKLNESDTETEGGLSINQIAAQAFVFFFAGFETSSTVMTFALHELAVNKEIQYKAREEIKQVLDKHEGRFSYEAMMDMSYIGQILNESLRKYPPVGNLMRVVTKDYHVPNSKHVLPKGTRVWVPVHAIHRDPEYYPNAEKFDPERFSIVEMNKRDNFSFLPFGNGPRNCIGLRFGLMQARVGLVTLLSNYEFSLCSKSTIPLEMDKKSFILSPNCGMWLNIKHIDVSATF